MERSEPDKLVDSMDFGELCNEFVCISSPLVEATARQLTRDILELREGNRALGSFAISVKYKVCHVLASQFGGLSQINFLGDSAMYPSLVKNGIRLTDG
jgi:hypothetical protein